VTAGPALSRLVLACLFGAGIAACQLQAPSTFVDRADIELALRTDGSVEVYEQFDVRVEDSPVVFERAVNHAHVDDLVFLNASLNGDELAPGGGDDLTVREGHTLRVRWKLPAGHAGTRHRVTLKYRALGVVFVGEGQGWLEWPALPAGRTFAVDAARVDLHLPTNPSASDSRGMLQAGWEVSETTDGIIATGTGVGLAPAVVVAQIPIFDRFGARVPVTIPTWQVTEDLRREFAPAFVSGALFMLVIGGGIVWMLHVKHPRVRGSGASLPDAEERVAAASGLRTSALAVAILAAACMALAALFLPRFGWWGQLIPVSIALVAVLLYSSAGRFVR